MKTGFTSVRGTVTVSALALLAFVGYTLMEMRYFLAKWIPGDGAAAVEVIAILLIAGGWLWALFAAHGGRRGGFIALTVFSAFTILIAVYDVQYALQGMPWPETLMWAVMGIVSIVAAAVQVMRLRQKGAAG